MPREIKGRGKKRDGSGNQKNKRIKKRIASRDAQAIPPRKTKNITNDRHETMGKKADQKTVLTSICLRLAKRAILPESTYARTPPIPNRIVAQNTIPATKPPPYAIITTPLKPEPLQSTSCPHCLKSLPKPQNSTYTSYHLREGDDVDLEGFDVLVK
jgi:hypothetical protein